MTQVANSTLLDPHVPLVLPNGHPGDWNEKTQQNALKKRISPALKTTLSHALEELDTQAGQYARSGSSEAQYADSVYQETMRNGMLSLLGVIEIPESQAWEDAMEYCREVIRSPQDNVERAGAEWSRSYSDVCRHLLSRFSPGIVAAARSGCESFVCDHYQGNARSIAHVNKEMNIVRFLPCHNPGFVFHPKKSVLAAVCGEMTARCCSIVTSAWLSPEESIKSGMLSHVALSEEYPVSTGAESKVRLCMVALSVGVAYEAGGQVVNALVDGAAMLAVGTGDQMTVDAVRAWRAVSGCTTPYSSYLWGGSSLKDGLVVPEMIMAMHDLLDWRSDMAARNHENGVSAVYGLGFKDAFHTYLESTLERASSEPLSGAHAMAGVVYLHFTSIRYGSYRYRGDIKKPCQMCQRVLRNVTAKAGLEWKPVPPPSIWSAGDKFRELSKRVVDRFEEQPLVQIGLSWLQHLVVSGEIGLFDALVRMKTLDSRAE